MLVAVRERVEVRVRAPRWVRVAGLARAWVWGVVVLALRWV